MGAAVAIVAVGVVVVVVNVDVNIVDVVAAGSGQELLSVDVEGCAGVAALGRASGVAVDGRTRRHEAWRTHRCWHTEITLVTV